MTPDLILFLTSLATLVIGWLAFDVLLHRPTVARHAATVADLRKQLADAEARANRSAKRAADIRADRDAQQGGARLLARRAVEHDARHTCLPHLDGIRAASRDAVTLADDFRRDFDGADVIPLRGLS